MAVISKVIFDVEGMTCGACVAAIETQLKLVEGVQRVSVSLVTSECEVVFDSGKTSVDAVENGIIDCGFDARVLKVLQESAQACKIAVLQVQGMTCASCVASITENLERLDGVTDVSVSLATMECRVVFQDPQVTAADVKATIEDCGFDAELITEQNKSASGISETKRIVLKVLGMTCGSCSASIESSLSQEPGILQVQVSLVTEEAVVEFSPSVIGVRDIVAKIEDLGYESAATNAFDNVAQIKALARVREIQFWKSSCIQACCLMVVMILLYKIVPRWSSSFKKSIIYHQSPLPGLFYRDIIGFVISSYVQFWVGRHFYKAGWKSIKHGSGSMDTFVLVSTMCAFTFSVYSVLNNIIKRSDRLPNVVFDASTMLIAFISLGKLLENKAKSRTNNSLSKLISLAPSSCTIIENEVAKDIPVDFLQVGDIIEMKPGAKIPTDGVIIEGESEIDESLMTGESLMVPRYKGDTVVGGSINGPNRFLFKAMSVGDDTKLAHIIQTMKQAQLTKAPMQHYADYLAARFVPFILTLAAITFVMWYSLSHYLENPPTIFDDPNGKFFVCLQISISVIVVACPCALGLAAPTAIMVGTGLGARHGVLIKGGEVLEKCGSLETFLFDKTGTLTTGHMVVDQFVPLGENVALTVEQAACVNVVSATSEHPVAKALVSYTTQYLNGTSIKVNLLNCRSVIGGGIICDCEIGGSKFHVVVGNKTVLQEFSHLPKPQGTVSYVEVNGKLIGRFEVSDYIKKDAGQVVRYLTSKGHRVCMVTGDNHYSAMKAASEIGIEANNVYSELTPSDKNEIVKQLQDGGRTRVAFVGDGINDSPALVTSDLGISISTGTDIAMEAADVIILSRTERDHASLRELVYALDIAQATFKRVRMNFFWAICYNVFMVPIAMGVLVPWGITLDPIFAVACMAASSVSVVGSSLLLNRWKAPSLESKNPGRSKMSFRSIPSFLSAKFRRHRSLPIEDVELQAGLIV
ncbi:LANO_0H23090g1_1 [Lachancea nothofagi CBS 11611]|uniref:P-type Cu(+) transporter n=1 Tax=Lachancea nothofagi CBS 11611 TaxID=1266666 RepID=A0A1G4KNL0_9SACH|nr:LANO_0H23090g1_1 [Lachancea nothofagi CBS 11611]